MIEIFRTNVNTHREAETILTKMAAVFPGYVANFDLQDCDRVLRVDSNGAEFSPQTVIALVKKFGYWAEVMPDVVYQVETTGLLL
jgi:hypothetical protein